jgi:hypothetical protein
MTQQILPSTRSHCRVDGFTGAAPGILAAARQGAVSARDAIAALGGLIWAVLIYRRAFDLAAARVNDDLFDAPVAWADISAKAWERALRSSEEAGAWRLPLGAGALIVALALSAAIVQLLV